MPDAWSGEDERQDAHVRESELERGATEAQDEETAAPTVNRHRCEEGRTPNKRTRGTGNPNHPLTSAATNCTTAPERPESRGGTA